MFCLLFIVYLSLEFLFFIRVSICVAVTFSPQKAKTRRSLYIYCLREEQCIHKDTPCKSSVTKCNEVKIVPLFICLFTDY